MSRTSDDLRPGAATKMRFDSPATTDASRPNGIPNGSSGNAPRRRRSGRLLSSLRKRAASAVAGGAVREEDAARVRRLEATVENKTHWIAKLRKRLEVTGRALEESKRQHAELESRFADVSRLLATKSTACERQEAAIKVGSERQAKLRSTIANKDNWIEKLRDRASRHKKQVDAGLARHATVIQRKDEWIAKLRERLDHRDKVIARLKDSNKVVEPLTPMVRVLSFAEFAESRADELVADAYVAHDMLPLPAMYRLAEVNGGMRCCDVIETPSYSDRTVVPSWTPAARDFVDRSLLAYLRNCDQLLTIGAALAQSLEVGDVPVNVVPNYRYRESFTQTNQLREQCGLADTDVIVLCISTVASGFESVIRTVSKLPEHYHLVSIGRFVPASYRDTVDALVETEGVRERVHFLDQVPYEELTSFISPGSVGLIVRDPALLNNYISLPNRVFDYLAAGVPICAPYMPDISRIVVENNCGRVIDGLDAEHWANGIRETVESCNELKENAANAAETMCWEAVEPSLLELFEGRDSVTFLGIKDLSKNNRTLRMARTLTAHGKRVNICVLKGQDIDSVNIPGVRWVSQN